MLHRIQAPEDNKQVACQGAERLKDWRIGRLEDRKNGILEDEFIAWTNQTLISGEISNIHPRSILRNERRFRSFV
jgi:hypothetical protein